MSVREQMIEGGILTPGEYRPDGLTALVAEYEWIPIDDVGRDRARRLMGQPDRRAQPSPRMAAAAARWWRMRGCPREYIHPAAEGSSW